MPAETWPPPPHPGDRHERAPVYVDGQLQPVELRVVRLWGRSVLIDEQSRVHCHACLELIPADELGRVDNGHPVGLPYRADGMSLPLPDDEEWR